MEERLDFQLPISLKSLLAQTDGVAEEIKVGPDQWICSGIVIYSIDEMIETNSYVKREYPDRNLRRFCFFSTAGTDGILFGFRTAPMDPADESVLAWYPDETADKRVADGLLQFLEGWCGGTTTV